MKGLKKQRIDKDVTQEEVSRATGISIHALRTYEQGKRNPKMKTLEILAKYFGCTIEELL